MSAQLRAFRGVFLAGLLTFLFASGCTSWKEPPTPPDQFAAQNPTTAMLITTPGLKPFEVRGVQIVRDSLFGVAMNLPAEFPRSWVVARNVSSNAEVVSTHVAIPAEAVVKVEARRTDAVKTAALLVGIGAIAAAIILASSVDDTEHPPPSSTTQPYYSCPLILSWNGDAWRLDSGTYAGAIMPALSRSDVDNLEHAREQDGLVRLRLTGLPGETEHVDELALLAVDHNPGESVVPDGRGALHTVGKLIPPTRAHDLAGRDTAKRVASVDGWCWESRLTQRDPSADAELRDGLEIEFPKPANARSAKLVVDGTNTVWAMTVLKDLVSLHGEETQGWYDAVSLDPAKAERIKGAFARQAFLSASIWGPKGWERQDAVWDSGPELLKRQVVPLDLSRAVGETVRVRLDSTPNFWLVDCVAIDFSIDRPALPIEMRPESARDMKGRDVRALLDSRDSREYVIAPGDTAEVAFRVPPTSPGQHRSYLARTTGWYRIHTPESGPPQTALADRVETEPFAAARYSVERFNKVLAVVASEPRE